MQAKSTLMPLDCVCWGGGLHAFIFTLKASLSLSSSSCLEAFSKSCKRSHISATSLRSTSFSEETYILTRKGHKGFEGLTGNVASNPLICFQHITFILQRSINYMLHLTYQNIMFGHNSLFPFFMNRNLTLWVRCAKGCAIAQAVGTAFPQW
jgi:hypothetical protein